MDSLSNYDKAFDALHPLTNDELMRLNKCIIELFRIRGRQAANTFYEGQKVSWNSKYGKTLTGTITKVMQKNIQVTATDGIRWKCSASILTKI